MRVPYVFFSEMSSKYGFDDCLHEECSPDLEGQLRRVDSDSSWKDSQGNQDQDDEDAKINKDKLFLVSLGTIMSLFT